jgi:4-hydroxy-4-methyl-2-oxoglutarate aldolase
MNEILQKMLPLHSTSFSDALRGRNVMASYIKPVIPDMKLIGPAYTVRPIPGDHLSVVKALSTAAKGDVLVIDGGNVTEVALLGEMMCTFAKKRGLAGAVVDGAIRDVAGIRRIGFQVFTRAIVPRSAVEESLGEVQILISCGGVSVNPRDWIIGDDDGVTVIPAEIIEEAIDGARASEAVDEALRGGADFLSFLGMDRILEEKEKAAVAGHTPANRGKSGS